jgi:hypothetical protein
MYKGYYVQFTTSWGKLYKHNILKNFNFPINKIHEDEYTTYKLLYKSNKVVFTNKKMYNYLQRCNSTTGSGFILKNKIH